MTKPLLPVLFLFASAVTPFASFALGAEAGSGVLRQLNDGLIGVFDKVAPAVVVIEVEKKIGPNEEAEETPQGFDSFFQNPQGGTPGAPNRRFPMPQRAPQSQGSGFVVREDGFIITNNHVVEGAQKVTVKMKDGRSFPGKVVGTDDKTDVAVVKVDAKGLPVVEIGDSDQVKVGQLVCAIGTPYSLDYTFTVGVVSAKGRSNLHQAAYEEYIQTDASINPGNSGGPLCDIDGRVIGMNTLINGINRGLGFAIPSSMLKEVGYALIASGKVVRPWLGIGIETLDESDELRAQFPGIEHGVVVKTIQLDTPAYQSDLRPADVITAIDGVPVKSARDLQKEVLRKKVGDNVEMTIIRSGETKKLSLKTAQLPDDLRKASNVTPPAPEEPTNETAAYGIQVQDLTAALARSLSIEPAGGVLVSDVEAGSPSELAGIQAKDVIREVDSKPVNDAAAFRAALAKIDAKKGLLLFLDRNGEKTYAVLKAPSK